MLLSSCNGGQYVWWAFVITPNEFECLHELNVKVNQTLCGAEEGGGGEVSRQEHL